MSVTLLVVTRTTTFPYSVSSSTITFSGRSAADVAKTRIERSLSEYGSSLSVTITILEGTA